MVSFIKNPKKPRLPFFRGLPPFGEITGILNDFDLLPAIFFLKSRKDCDLALLNTRALKGSDPKKKELLLMEVENAVERNPELKKHRQLKYIRDRAVAAHHGGQLPVWKLFVESLMEKGLLNAVFATSTVAAGVNFPARTIIIFNSDRFNGKDFLPLTSTDFHQMTGRAGRRGKDSIGFSLAVPGRFLDIFHIAKLSSQESGPVVSQLAINFSMVLNLLLSKTVDDIKYLLQKTFAAYKGESQEERARIQKRLWMDFSAHLDYLKITGYVDDQDRLTEEGRWASLLRVNNPLSIAQCFREKAMPGGNPALMASVIASFTWDRTPESMVPSSYLQRPVSKAFKDILEVLIPFHENMREWGFNTPTLSVRPAATVYSWARGDLWEVSCRKGKMAEGDLAMLILRTADNLRQVSRLESFFPNQARSATRARELILRPPVVDEY